MSHVSRLDVCTSSVPFVVLLSPFFAADVTETKVSDDALKATFSDMFKCDRMIVRRGFMPEALWPGRVIEEKDES